MSQKYLDLAYFNFLDLYRQTETIYASQSRTNPYLKCLNLILSKLFPQEKLNEENSFNKSFTPSKIKSGGKSPQIF